MADDDLDLNETPPADPPPKPKRVRNRQKPKVSTSRLERRAGKVTATIREATHWKLKRDPEALSFTETVERDAEQLGHAIAAAAERFRPAGLLIDLLFGEAGPLSILVALAPSIRAGRRTLTEKAKTRRQKRAEEKAARELEQQQGYDAGSWEGIEPQPDFELREPGEL